MTLAWTVKDQGSIPHWGTNVSTHYVSNCIIWASVGSQRGSPAHTSLRTKIFLILCSLSENLYVGAPPEGLAPLPTRNPDLIIGIGSIKITLFLDMQWINVFSTVGPSELCSFNTNAATKNRIQKMTSRGFTLRRMLARKMTSLLNNWWVI